MQSISVKDGELEVESYGNGAPVLLIHGSIIADAFLPMCNESTLTDKYRLLSYHRRGFAGSSRAPQPFSIGRQASDALAVMKHFGFESAHVVGHSYGGVIGLQLSQDAPGAIRSLTLLEPALLDVPAGADFAEAMVPVAAAFAAGEPAGALNGFLTGVFNPGWEERVNRTLPAGWFEQAVADADTFFQVEFPAIQEWAFTDAHAGRVKAPILAVLGGDSSAQFVQGFEKMKGWWPQAETFVLPGVTHDLEFGDPAGMAKALAGFLDRHTS